MESRALNILFLGGGKRVSIAETMIREGQEAGFHINIFGYELDMNVPLREVATIILGYKWSESLNHLLAVIDERSINIVIPFVDPAIELAAELVEKQPKIFSPVSDQKLCSLFYSKIATQEWCLQNNIKVPPFEPTIFPIIAKPDKGSASKGIFTIHNSAILQIMEKDYSFILQNFIEATEYTVDAYRSVSSGNINYLVPRIRIETQGGESVKSITIHHKEIEEISRQIIALSEIRGAITLQFLEDKNTKQVFFLELNPRFGGGVVTLTGAGVSIWEAIQNDYLKLYSEENSGWRSGTLMIRRFKESFYYADNY